MDCVPCTVGVDLTALVIGVDVDVGLRTGVDVGLRTDSDGGWGLREAWEEDNPSTMI